MLWCLLGTGASATIMMTQAGRCISGVSQRKACIDSVAVVIDIGIYEYSGQNIYWNSLSNC